MKTKLINLFAVLAIIASATSCKGEKQNETETSDAEEVKEAPAAALTYSVNTTSSVIEWTGKKPAGLHTGTIKLSGGEVTAETGKIQSGSFVIDMNTITVTDLEGDEKAGLEGHLKGEGEGKEDHFFNVAQFPKATFEVTGVTEEAGKTMLSGNLTIKGISKNISVPVSSKVDPNGVSLTSEVFTINRTDWGVNYGSKSIFENLGDKFINDDIELKISIQANPTS